MNEVTGPLNPPNPPSQAICDFAIHERSQLQFHEHQLRDPEPSSHHTLPYLFPACRLLHWILNWPRQARWYLSLAGWSSEFLVLPTCAVPLALGRQYLFGARLLSVLQETSHVAAIHSEAPTPLRSTLRRISLVPTVSRPARPSDLRAIEKAIVRVVTYRGYCVIKLELSSLRRQRQELESSFHSTTFGDMNRKVPIFDFLHYQNFFKVHE